MTGKENKSNFIDIIVYAMMLVAIIYIIVQTILNNNGEASFKITLGLWMLGAIIISDFVEPLICEEFDNMTAKAAALYGLYAVSDAVAYTSLYIFIINIGYTKEPIHNIFVGIAAVFFGLRILFSCMYKKEKKRLVPEVKKDEADETKESIEEDDIEINTLSEEDEDDIKVIVYRNRDN